MSYMSPEVLAGRGSYPGDIWSLGMTLMHMATGVCPWQHLDYLQFNNVQLIFHIAQRSNPHPLPAMHLPQPLLVCAAWPSAYFQPHTSEFLLYQIHSGLWSPCALWTATAPS